ncbi:MAG: cyclic nucleotide-binding domain-containing protein [Deltaproteobacteria bacterium]|nr:cyclic nucleotide-binding domain-containing protein [Deltaproteobacteria bacterium]
MCQHKAAANYILSGEYKEALCAAGPVLKSHSSDLTAWYLLARAVLGLGDTDVGIKNLKSVAMAMAEERRPILALAVIKEIEDLGSDIDDLVTKLAAMYSTASSRAEEAELAPPPLPSITPLEAWDSETDNATLVEWAKETMAVAWGESLANVDKDRKLPFIPLLSSLEPSDFVLLVEAFWRQVFEPGDVIIEQDTEGDAIYVIAQGEVAVLRRSSSGEAQELAKLGPGAFIGEMAIVTRAPRAAEVRAIEHTVVLRADKKKTAELAERAPEIGNVLIAFCHARMIENLMHVSPVLSPVPVARRPEVIALFDSDYFESGQVIIQEEQEAPGLYLVASGRVEVVKMEAGDKVVMASLGPGDVFGEISLIMRRPSTATVVAAEDTAVLFLSSADFGEVTKEFPELLKGAFDIALEREAKTNSILASEAAAADDLVLV